jgi:plasmid stability protein
MEVTVAQLIVRDLDDYVKEHLKERARRHGRSMEEEVRDILCNAVKGEGAAQPGLGSRIAARFTGIGLSEPIPELRGHSSPLASDRRRKERERS